MRLWIREAKKEDLNRVVELIQRTNQLNATVTRYSKNEVQNFYNSSNNHIYVANLWDKYGAYGLIGVIIVEKCDNKPEWIFRSFLFSCRAMGKTVEQNTLIYIKKEAKKKNIKKIISQYNKTDRNSAIEKVFKEAKFTPISTSGKKQEWIFKLNSKQDIEYDKWMKVIKKPLK